MSDAADEAKEKEKEGQAEVKMEETDAPQDTAVNAKRGKEKRKRCMTAATPPLHPLRPTLPVVKGTRQARAPKAGDQTPQEAVIKEEAKRADTFSPPSSATKAIPHAQCSPRKRHRTAKVAPETNTTTERAGTAAVDHDEASASSRLVFVLSCIQQILKNLQQSRPLSPTKWAVFGWKCEYWCARGAEEETPVLVYRAAKQFHSVDMYTLANALWHVKASRLKKAFPEILVAEVVCALSPYARIVRQIDRLHDRQAHESLWIEYIFDRGHFVAIGRRQLKSFRQYQSSTATLECHGVILRPLLTPLPDGCFQIGCSVQRIMSINPRNKDVPDMQRHFVDDLPRHILEWEEAFVHDAEPNLLNFFPTSPFATPSIG